MHPCEGRLHGCPKVVSLGCAGAAAKAVLRQSPLVLNCDRRFERDCPLGIAASRSSSVPAPRQ